VPFGSTLDSSKICLFFFSSTIPTVTITQDQVVPVVDVRRNGLCFTDGIGRISPDLADKVARFLPGVNKPPCAF
jgi:hypothetical protein